MKTSHEDKTHGQQKDRKFSAMECLEYSKGNGESADNSKVERP